MTRIEDLLDVATRSALAAVTQPSEDSLLLNADEYGEEDVPGGCVYCWGSGVIEDFEGDRDCSGCDGTGTPVERPALRSYALT
ncbi:hypothetical protein ABID81_002545 [Frigoribacterium sp. PvP054]|uniref:hypothetical protein n=1 Tax=Frigoribacterium sp. PvP054 TaxID=3156438 RepID=UPI0033960E51